MLLSQGEWKLLLDATADHLHRLPRTPSRRTSGKIVSTNSISTVSVPEVLLYLTRDGMGQREDDSCHFPFFVFKRYSVTGHRRSLRENFPVATIEATITGDIIDSIVSLLHFKVKVTSSRQRTRYQLTTPNGTLPLSNEHPGNHTLVLR